MGRDVRCDCARQGCAAGWIDFDAGLLIEGIDQDALAKKLIRLVIETAEGKKTKQETNNYREIAIFKSGVTL